MLLFPDEFLEYFLPPFVTRFAVFKLYGKVDSNIIIREMQFAISDGYFFRMCIRVIV